jgi:hypothetical protein
VQFEHLRPNDHAEILAGSLTALWTIYRHLRVESREELPDLERILDALSQAQSSAITPSVITMAKMAVLAALDTPSPNMMSEDLTSRLKHPILPAETFFPGYVDRVPQETSQEHHQRLWTVLQNRCMEGNLNILTEFIESCCSSHLPFKAADTLERTGELFPESAVHSTHQLRFATAVKTCSRLVLKTMIGTVSYMQSSNWVGSMYMAPVRDGLTPNTLHGWRTLRPASP